MRSPQPQERAFAGQPHPHESGLPHCTGEAAYVDDIPDPPGLLHGALVLSPYAHGEIDSIDADAALAIPGVVAVLTAHDIPGENAVGPIIHDEPALAERRVTYRGEPVAFVLGDSYSAAQAGADAVRVEVKPAPPILELRQAHRNGDYVVPPQLLSRGNSAEAIAKAPHRARGELELGGQDHFYLETQAALAIPGDDGALTIWSSTQHPSEVQERTAVFLGVPSSRIEVRVRRLGGAFGGKESQATIYAVLTALGAQKTNRPVKLRLDRRTDMTATGKRHDFQISWEAGYRDDGRILGLEFEFLSRAGNVADLSAPVMTRALVLSDNCYAFDHVSLRGYCCRTNTVSNTAFRGFGGPQGVAAIESVLDDIARRLNLPPNEVRAINYYGDANGYRTPCGQVIRQCHIDKVVSTAIEDSQFGQRRREIDKWNRTNSAIRRGLAMMPVKFAISFNIPSLNQGGALIHVYRDGSVRLNHGGTEMGQGLFIKVAQVVAEVFQVPLSCIHITPTNTGEVPNTSPTAASTGSDINGMAAFKAARTIRRRMEGIAAREFECPAKDIEFREGRVQSGNRSVSFGELAEACWRRRVSLSATGYYRTPGLRWDPAHMRGTPAHYYTWGAAVTEAAVDLHTGESRILRADLVQDCGESLNPAIDLGQIEGGFIQGLGWLTCEELVWDRDGRLLTVGPSTYKIPGSRDVPPEFNIRLLQGVPNEAKTVFRSKAVGEPPLLLAISGWLAIRDAIASVAPPRTPIPLGTPATPERIRLAIEAVRNGSAVTR